MKKLFALLQGVQTEKEKIKRKVVSSRKEGIQCYKENKNKGKKSCFMAKNLNSGVLPDFTPTEDVIGLWIANESYFASVKQAAGASYDEGARCEELIELIESLYFVINGSLVFISGYEVLNSKGTVQFPL